ncbi:MAG: hypothetical protein O7G85_04925 [Planctomycetota bacterium]|nr:hypothetical protein [Planctomycetota bacterium]
MAIDLKSRFRPLHKLLITGAWAFIILSLVKLAMVVGIKIDDPEGITRLYSAFSGSELLTTFGLNYTDESGLIHALTQIVAVMLAASVTMVNPKTVRRLKFRKIAHGALCIWAGWWATNLIALAGQSPELGTLLQAGLLSGMFGCTAYRAGNGCMGQKKKLAEQANPSNPVLSMIEKVVDELEEAIEEPSAPINCDDDGPFDYTDPDQPEAKPEFKPSTPTGAFFAAIAPEPLPEVEEFEVEVTIEQPPAKPSILTRIISRVRFGKRKVQEHVNRENFAKIGHKAKDAAHHGHDFVVHKGGKFARRAKPVAQTAYRETCNAWRKTIDALKESESMKTNEVPNDSSTNQVA